MLRRLPDPMLAKAGRLPTRDGFAYEVKWDGFRCIAATDGVGSKARSRRGWNLAPLIPEVFVGLPPGVYDGELVAFRDGVPHFPDVSARLLHGDVSITLTLMVFDVLALPEGSLLDTPYRTRRVVLEELPISGPHARVSETFDDGAALFAATCDAGLEGVMAKRLDDRYRPGVRAWVKVKNGDYWRRNHELHRGGSARASVGRVSRSSPP